MDAVIKLERQFDVDLLSRDLATAERESSGHLHPGPYHDGGWSAIALMSIGGRTDTKALTWSGPKVRSGFSKTPILERCPYFAEILDSFECEKQRVRLMRLAPGARIHDHSDGAYWSWKLQHTARFHIPIVTHEDVQFYVAGQRARMQPGELWYCDFGRVHRVSNDSPIARVHLVIDLTMNRWLRSLFPRETLFERSRNGAYQVYYGTGVADLVARVHRRRNRVTVAQD